MGRDARVKTMFGERVAESGNERNTAIRDDETFRVPMNDSSLLEEPVGRGDLERERERSEGRRIVY